MASKEDRYIVILNMTWFFSRELFMSALGDIKLSKPISLKKVAYTMFFLLAWTLPIFLIVGLNFSLPYLVLLFAPPLVLGNFAAKPVWGGKNLVNFVKSMLIYIREPKGWADLRGVKNPDDQYHYVEQEIWISRRRELFALAKARSEENE